MYTIFSQRKTKKNFPLKLEFSVFIHMMVIWM